MTTDYAPFESTKLDGLQNGRKSTLLRDDRVELGLQVALARFRTVGNVKP